VCARSDRSVSDADHRDSGSLDKSADASPKLLRALGPGMAIAIVVGNVIGSGIFAKPGEIAAQAGSFPLILTGWIVGGIFCMLGALCFAELAAMLPRAGGLYVYLRESFGRPVAFLFGFNEFVFGRPASIGAMAVYLVGLWADAAGIELSTTLAMEIAVAVIGVIAWVNVVGVIWGGRVQGVTTLIKAGFLGFIALLPFVLQAAGYPTVETANYTSTVAPIQTTLAAQFAAVLLAVMWAYNGWHDVAPVAEEIRDPQKNIPRALVAGVAILIVLYVGANLAYHGVLSMQEVKAAGEGTAQAMIRRVLAPFGSQTAAIGGSLMAAVIMCSVFGAINCNLLLGPRVSFAMGRDDVFVRQLGAVHANYRTPAVSIVVQAAMSALLVIVSGLLVRYVNEFRERSIFEMMTDYVTFSANVFYTLCVVGLLVLRWKHPEWERPYRTWGYPLVPLIFIAGNLWFLVQVYYAKPAESLAGIWLIVLGVPVYYVCRWWAARHPQPPAS